MTREELENELKLAYYRGYTDVERRDYDFHQHSYSLLDNFENRTCKSCKYSEVEDNVWKSMRCKCDKPSIMPYEDGAIYLNIYEDFCCNQYEPKENK